MSTAVEERLREALAARAGQITAGSLQPASPPSRLAVPQGRRFALSVPVWVPALAMAAAVFAVFMAWHPQAPGPSNSPEAPPGSPAPSRTRPVLPVPEPSATSEAPGVPEPAGTLPTTRPGTIVPGTVRPSTAEPGTTEPRSATRTPGNAPTPQNPAGPTTWPPEPTAPPPVVTTAVPAPAITAGD